MGGELSISLSTMHDWVRVLAHNSSRGFYCDSMSGVITTVETANERCDSMQLCLGKLKLCSQIRYSNSETIYFILGIRDSYCMNYYTTLNNDK